MAVLPPDLEAPYKKHLQSFTPGESELKDVVSISDVKEDGVDSQGMSNSRAVSLVQEKSIRKQCQKVFKQDGTNWY